MEAFRNDQQVKDLFVNRMIEHGKVDEIIQGTTWGEGRGCFIGCSFHEYAHSKFSSEGIGPVWLAKLADRIFEGLTREDSQKFAVEFYPAIPLGADLEKVKMPFLIFVVESTLDTFDHKKFPQTKNVIDGVLVELKKDKIDIQKLRKARAAAADAADAAAADAYAAAAAAYAFAYAAAAAAAYAAAGAGADAADAYAGAAADAAGDAAGAAAAAADARSKTYKKFADKLLELFRGLKGSR